MVVKCCWSIFHPFLIGNWLYFTSLKLVSSSKKEPRSYPLLYNYRLINYLVYSKYLLIQPEWNCAYLCQLIPNATDCHSERNVLFSRGYSILPIEGNVWSFWLSFRCIQLSRPQVWLKIAKQLEIIPSGNPFQKVATVFYESCPYIAMEPLPWLLRFSHKSQDKNAKKKWQNETLSYKL